jgi:hypothetical protein
LPFIPELKPLRVRVLGKVLHRKNVSLQSFCLRLIVRLLLVMAESYRELFACVSGIFHFSCDELIVQLREGCSPHDTHALAFEINSFVSSLKWDGWLPIRVELFELNLHTLPDQLVDGGDLQVFDEERGVTRLYRGHPILRTSAQFVDLPSALDPTWEEPSLPALSAQESCPDGFFTRTVHCIHDHTAQKQKVQFKKLPNSFRPRVVMNHMKSKLSEKMNGKPSKSFSASAKEFTAAVATAVASSEPARAAKSGSLSTTAQEFVPGQAATPTYSMGGHTVVRVHGSPIPTSAATVKEFVPRGLQVAVEAFRPAEQCNSSSSSSSSTGAKPSLSHTAVEFVPTVFSNFTAEDDGHASRAGVGLSSAAPEFVPSFYVLDEPVDDMVDESKFFGAAFSRVGQADVSPMDSSGETLKLSGAAPVFVPATYLRW